MLTDLETTLILFAARHSVGYLVVHAVVLGCGVGVLTGLGIARLAATRRA